MPGYDGASDVVGIAAASFGADLPTAGASIVDLAGELLSLLETQPTTLVVDDYHLGRGEECDPLIAEVLPLVPRGSGVVLCSRVRPPGLLGRVSDGLLRVVGADELAFTEEEAAALFERRGRDPATGSELSRQLAGWAAGLSMAAESGVAGEAVEPLVHQTLLRDTTDAERAAVEALAVLPYLTSPVAAAIGVDTEVLDGLVERTMLVTEQSTFWRLHQVACDVLEPEVAPARATALRRAAAPVIEETDPAAAIDLLLAGAEHEAAADVLSRHLSAIGVQRAVRWLYRLPPELRHQFPPVLAAGKATVDLDEALARAERQLQAAPDDATRREALFALASAHAHAGALASAAGALEAAVTPGAEPLLAERGHGWLGVVRWWAGDLVGARAALVAAGDNPLAHWARAEVALAQGALDEAEEHARRGRAAGTLPDAELTEAPCLSVLARLALVRADQAVARGQAQAAYRVAAEAGGIDLAAAAPVHAWTLVNGGEFEEALAVADFVERRIGRHDAYARVQVQLVRLAVGTARADAEGVRRAEARLHELRRGGFALVEAQARALLAPLAARPPLVLRVEVLGASRVEVAGEVLPLKAWRSHKALEVLQYLALAGEHGAHREEVIEAVWPERDPDKGRVLLRAALSEIRRRLEPGRQTGEPSRFVDTVGDRVRVEAETDLAHCRALAKDGRHTEALAQFRGGLLEDDPYLEWASEERRAAEILRVELAERVAADAATPLTDRSAAIEVLLAAEPWRTELYEQLAALHRQAGDEARARAAERRGAEA
jgi:DNA-binding SARP family transcriptional activator